MHAHTHIRMHIHIHTQTHTHTHSHTRIRTHTGAGSLPPPIAELLLAFLTSLEEAVVLPLQLCMKQHENGAYIAATLEHIAPGTSRGSLSQV